MNVGLISETHSCGNSAPVACTLSKVGASQRRTARFLAAWRIRSCRSFELGGDGDITSHVNGARCAGSAARRMCNKVVPLRGKPTTNNGSRIPCCAITGFEQAGQWLTKFSRTEVLETTATLRCLDEFGGGRRCRSYADFFEPGTAFVQQPNRKRSASLLDGRRGAHTSTIVAGAPEGKPASCATDTAVPSFLYDDGESDVRGGVFLGRRRDFSQ